MDNWLFWLLIEMIGLWAVTIIIARWIDKKEGDP